MTGLTPAWKKSARSNGSSSCVEARERDGQVEFRDSKDPAGPVLSIYVEDHLGFVNALKAGHFDRT